MMRGYGLPRTKDLEYPDLDDIHTYGLASHVGQFAGKSGDFHGPKPHSKARMRRMWKRKERIKAKIFIRKEIDENI